MTQDVRKINRIAVHVENILNELDPNWSKDSEMEQTPIRVAKAWLELTKGYQKEDFKPTAFDTTYKGMVTRKDIPIYSICAHHMLPYVGKCHVGLICNGQKLGLSKIIRAVQHWSARFTSQEELTQYIVNKLNVLVKPLGVIVIIEAEHMCEALRGVRVANVPTITSWYIGAYEDLVTRDEFLRLIGR